MLTMNECQERVKREMMMMAEKETVVCSMRVAGTAGAPTAEGGK